ncbi:carbonic anhydrase [Streptomyces caniscabiei]|uniref:Carbonic anhydrase n=1 Tax=Streptomyces caniscabiei TaxID=2746961 RepID=A0A927QNN2_9ACTN|nr:carbonic anhydrase [Streptomyces caniscabiei]MBD9728097.1 carbonic anhydrase [Streptomyces caniscabiei]MDX3513885.1 carbonic anhydrase [Streptomyces caniscabiei]MDX3722887.1 carbonic anhydrase [Streptomyces caniscabiei]MDX3731482.1 carbonic anhydrase [Streptomyces caniscabiei]WEO23585.1 carbonic anhydrase [Streptomyces caniscabiei]
MNSDATPHRGDGAEVTATGADAPISHAKPRGRRSLLRAALAGTAVVGGGLAVGAFPADAEPVSRSTRSTPGHSTPTRTRPATADEALKELSKGNRRWRTFHERHPDEDYAVRRALTTGQQPFALVLGCIDSRVPPELVFDQGLGDLMTVRSAGEVLDQSVLGSVKYGVLELKIPLVMVLGHQSCGAVKAAVAVDESGEELPSGIQYIADEIAPAIDHGVTGDARVAATIDANVRLVRSKLQADPDIAAKLKAGEVAVVGARYDLTTQRVHLLK